MKNQHQEKTNKTTEYQSNTPFPQPLRSPTKNLFGKHPLLAMAILSIATFSGYATPGTIPLVTTHPPGVNKNDSEYKAGYLNVTKAPYNADPTGVIDSTQKIQDAINDARDYHLVCFFPSGTYLISDTIEGRQTGSYNNKNKWINERTKPCVLVGSKIGPRPVIKLKNNASGFTSGSWKAAVIIWTQSSSSLDPSTTQNNENFNQLFSGIDINLGTGNNKAVGIWFGGSQGSSLENVKIYSDSGNFHYGMYSPPGQGGGSYNVEVVGGKYGFYGIVGTRYPILVGCKFIDQTTAPIKYIGKQPFVLVGCHIKNNTNAPIVMANEGHQRLSFIDCIIETQGTFVDNSVKKNLYMENVYLKGVTTIVDKGSNQWNINNSSVWTHVSEYSYCKSGNYKNLVNGNINTAEYKTKSENAGDPPTDLLNTHIWDEKTAPSFEDNGVVNVKTDLGANNAIGNGSANDTAALQYEIDNYENVFLPKGTYRITSPLVLRSNTKFFGAPKVITRIAPRSNWNPSTNKPLIKTDNDADATTVLYGIYVDLHPDRPNFTPLMWQAGRKSVVSQFLIGIEERASNNISANNHLLHAKNNGGGRWRVVCGAWQMLSKLTKSQSTRLMLIENTSEPLHMYAVNTERSLSNVQAEINNAQNVSIYYYKSEAGTAPGSGGLDETTTLRINNSNNIAVYGVSGSIELSGNLPIIDAIDSHDVALGHMRTFASYNEFPALTVRENYFGTVKTVNSDKGIALFKRGNPSRVTDGVLTPPPSGGPYLLENESLTMKNSSGDSATTVSNANASSGSFFKYSSNQMGDFVEFEANIAAGSYDVLPIVGPTSNSAIVQLSVVGEQNIGSPQDLYSASNSFEERNFGSITFTTSGIKVFRYEVTGKNASSSGYLMRLDALQLLPASPNSPPSIDPVTNQTINEGDSLNISVNATDPDTNDALTLSATGLPVFGTLQDNGNGTGTLTFTPNFSQSGSYTITVTVDDGNGESDSTTFTLSVNNVNQDPVLANIADANVNESDIATIHISSSDPDQDSLILAPSNLPAFGTLTDNGDGTGTITLSPDYTHSGIYGVTVSVTDGQGGTDDQTITITVTNVNQTPVLNSIANLTIDENDNSVINISSSDPDLDSIFLMTSNLPAWGSLTDNGDGTGTITLNPGYSDSGIYNITVSASDGSASDSKSFTLTVSNNNRPPSIASIANQATDENTTLQVSISSTDPDTDDTLSLSVSELPPFATFIDNGDGTGTIDFAPLSDDAGSYNMTATVNDGNSSQNTASTSFQLTVVDVPDTFHYENDFSSASTIDSDFGTNNNDWTCSGGKLVRSTTTNFRRLHLDIPEAAELTDYTFEIDVKTITPGNGLNTAAVMVRYVNKFQFYQIQINANGDIVIRKKNDNSDWVLLNETTSKPYNPMANQNFRLVVDVYGSTSTTIDVYVNGASTPSLSATDSNAPLTQGPPAFETKNAADVEFDNMLVYE